MGENNSKSDDEPRGSDRREKRRVQISSGVAVKSLADLMTGAGTDVSVGGIYVVTPQELPVGAIVDLGFRLDALDRRFDVMGEVRWRQRQPVGDEIRYGLGIEFIDLDHDDRSALRSYIERHDTAESDEIETQDGEKIHLLDRRESERVPLPAEVDVKTTANFTQAAGSDLSVGGMYLIAPEKHPIGTILDLEVHVEGMDGTFHALAEVKWRQPQPIGDRERVGLGVEFVDLDPENREALDEFVDDRAPIEPETAFDDLERAT